MKRIMCYLAIAMIHHGSSEMYCTEPQLLVKETYCGYDNLTSLTMYSLNEEFNVNVAETLPHEGCGIDFNEPYLNNTFYVECEIAETNCYNEDLEAEKVKRDIFYLECEEVDLFENYTTFTVAYNDTNDNSTKMDTFRNGTTMDLAVLSTVATVNCTDADNFRNETTVTDDWSTLDVFGKGSASLPEIDTFSNETTTNLAVVSTVPTVNSTNADNFRNETTVTDDNWSTLDVFGKGSASSIEMDTFSNETTTDLAVVSTVPTVNSTDAYNFRDKTTVAGDSWSTLDVFGKGNATTTEIDVFKNETANSAWKEVKEDSPDSSKVLLILGYSAAGLGAAVGMAFGVHKLRMLVQSGTYLFPSTPSPPGFIELA